MIENDYIKYVYNDGGRAATGRKGHTGDCVTRAIAIAADLPYGKVYARMAEGNATQRKGKYDKYLERRGRKAKSGVRSASQGIYTKRKWFKEYMRELGFEWTATMQIGSGCRVHLRADELPKGRIVVNLSKHLAAVIDGVLNDTQNCSREGTRCVYGYWSISEERVQELRAEREALAAQRVLDNDRARRNFAAISPVLFGNP